MASDDVTLKDKFAAAVAYEAQCNASRLLTDVKLIAAEDAIPQTIGECVITHRESFDAYTIAENAKKKGLESTELFAKYEEALVTESDAIDAAKKARDNYIIALQEYHHMRRLHFDAFFELERLRKLMTEEE